MKLQYTDLNLKTKRTLTSKFFKDHNITYDNIDTETLNHLNTFLSTHPTFDRKKAFYQMMISETTLEKNLLLRYEKYVDEPLHTETFYRLKHGDEEGLKLYLEKNKSKGFGKTLEGQIKKYGLEEGTKRYNESNKKRAHTLENFIRLYGEKEGPIKYQETIDKKSMSEDNMIKLYGEKEGKIRFQQWKDKCKSSEENFIKRHGEELGKQKWQEFKDKSKSTKENFIRRHGKELGEEKWKKYKNAYGWSRASKQSLEIFNPLVEFSKTLGIDYNDIFYGVEDSFEYKIESDSRLFCYDFTIMSIKLIIEFNGSHVHPSKEKLTGEKWNQWKNAWTGESANTRYAQDMKKLKVAEDNRFTIIEIWDYEDKDKSLERCKKLISKKLEDRL